MSYGLGIDTGGTFTDAAVLDLGTREIVFKAKAPTNRGDLGKGIAQALREMPSEIAKSINMVALSTTLATNACVEGKGAHTALILLGYDEGLYGRLCAEYGLNDNVTTSFLPGKHTQRGEVEQEPDWDEFARLCAELKPQVAAIGICEYWGVRNPEFEQKARRIARDVSGLPVAAAHELTDEINSLRRAATTSLNARLIPLIDDLLVAVRKTLNTQGIFAPMMVVRGDGSLMTEAFARERPVETLLSGPAASLVGGMALCNLDDAVVVDIGGTTTDVAIIRGGRTALSDDGVNVGAFRTGTRAIHIRTVGLGGDSLITHNKNDVLILGPRRAMPISAAAEMRPDMRAVLERYCEEDFHRTYHRGEGFVLAAPANGAKLSPVETAILSALESGPMFIDELAEASGERPWFLPVERLEFLGHIQRFGLTLTDVWHITGEMSIYPAKAAAEALKLLALRLYLTSDELRLRVVDMACERLYRVIAEFLLSRRPTQKAGAKQEPDGERFMQLAWQGGGAEIDCRMVVPLPIIGIGAPTHLLLPTAAKALYTRAEVPADASIANAVGAISGSVLAEERVVVKPQYEPYGIDGYACHSPEAFMRFDELSDAVDWAKGEAARLVVERARAMGASEVEPIVEYRPSSALVDGGSEALFLEGVVIARGMGKLSF